MLSVKNVFYIHDTSDVTSVRYCRRTRATRCVSRNLCQLLHNCENNLHNTRARLTALCPGLPRSAGTRKVKPIWISLKQETLSGSGIRWTICKSVPSSRQITTPAPHRSVFFYRRIPFLPPNQQCKSTECTKLHKKIEVK